ATTPRAAAIGHPPTRARRSRPRPAGPSSGAGNAVAVPEGGPGEVLRHPCRGQPEWKFAQPIATPLAGDSSEPAGGAGGGDRGGGGASPWRRSAGGEVRATNCNPAGGR